MLGRLMGPSGTTIFNLPNDCIYEIFQRLRRGRDRDAFGQICPRFQKVRNACCLAIEFHHSLTSFKSMPLLERSLNPLSNLRSIYFTRCSNLSDEQLNQLRNCGPRIQQIERLCLDSCDKITDVGLSYIGELFSSLKIISLRHCTISDVGLVALATSGVDLKEIDLSYCLSVTDQGIHSLVQNCRKLLGIVITHCKDIRGSGFQGCSPTLAYVQADYCRLDPEGISSIVSGGGVKYLDISNVSLTSVGDLLGAIGTATSLATLNVKGCRGLGDESVTRIAKGCRKLVRWNLAQCHEVTLTGWTIIAENCHNLKVLEAEGCRKLCARALGALKEGCLNLSALYIKEGCLNLSALYINNCPEFDSVAAIFTEDRPGVLKIKHNQPRY